VETMNESEMEQFVKQNDIPLNLINDPVVKQKMIVRSGKKVYKSYNDAFINCPKEIMESPDTRFTIECLKDVLIE
jgi:hypothetical protein